MNQLHHFSILIELPLGRIDPYDYIKKTLLNHIYVSHSSYVFFSYANSENGKLPPRMVFVQVSLMLVHPLS